MHRLAVVVTALGLVACGVDKDDRPATLEYITVAILAPNCGNAQCHSSFRNEDGYTFDTVEKARASLNPDLNPGLVIPSESNESLLYQVLVSPGGENQALRMPYDQPIANRDVELIYHWIDEGADGLVLP
jgi:hypothetical protein